MKLPSYPYMRLNASSEIGLRLHLGVHKGMKWNDHKGMERN